VATVPSVRVVKSFSFKAGARLFSNRYHFNGGTPPDSTHWDTLFDAIVLQEKTVYPSSITITECLGYAAGSDVPVASKVYSTAGTFSAGALDHACPGECAALTRYSTSARSSKNHPIYCFNYYHGIFCDGATNHDLVSPTERTALETYAGHWISGFSDGGAVTAVRASPAGHAATGHITEEYMTHRDFPYSTSV
jgi:hypothetical protein